MYEFLHSIETDAILIILTDILDDFKSFNLDLQSKTSKIFNLLPKMQEFYL
jgi:hypothetical protein